MAFGISSSGIQNPEEKTGVKKWKDLLTKRKRLFGITLKVDFQLIWQSVLIGKVSNPSYEHCIASKETWQELTKNQKKYGLGNPKNHIEKQWK